MESWKIELIMELENLFLRSYTVAHKMGCLMQKKSGVYIGLDMQKNAESYGSLLEVRVTYGNPADAEFRHSEFVASFRVDHSNKAQIAKFLCEILENY